MGKGQKGKGMRRDTGWLSLSAFAIGLLAIGVYVWGDRFSLVGTEEASLEWVTTYEEGRRRADELGRPLMIDFTAEWCVACQELDIEVFQAPEVRARLAQEVVAVKIDYDTGDEETIAAIERFRVSGLPRVAFESSGGDFLSEPSFEGKVSVEVFLDRLDQVRAWELRDESHK